ncbi:glutamine--tRNA ligase/YqeY domain fusion protein [soil metagenome]
MAATDSTAPTKLDFIREIVADDLASGANGGRLVTRFPPEPNGYLHIGHAKSICLNFGLPLEFGAAASEARCHLRFDDTNPTKEESEYVESIKEDVRWLGFDWGSHLYFASDYFEQLYGFALQLIDDGNAYVDSQDAGEIRAGRGTLTEPGTNSPCRQRRPAENRALFEEMRAGVHPDGAHVLRAKIDMASPNLNLRDPVLYRILHARHHRTGDRWCLYPMYDFAHPLSDAIEGVTHSLCTLEFENHRPLYDWCVEHVRGLPSRPVQREFARLNLSYTVMSKRKLLQLVQEGRVSGWDDPRMPTLSGLRRRGVPPEAIRSFCKELGVTKFNSLSDVALLENAIRETLNPTALRRLAVLHPLKITLTNLPDGHRELLEIINNPEDESAGTRLVPFTRDLCIEQDDFLEDAPRKFFRLRPGGEVRLRGAYIIRCDEVLKDAGGAVTELRCTADLDTLGRNPADGRKVKGVIHWVSAPDAISATVRLYDRLLDVDDPSKEGTATFLDHLNPKSLQEIHGCQLEPALAEATPDAAVQFERTGYFVPDRVDSTPEHPVFNRTVALRDTWAKMTDSA